MKGRNQKLIRPVGNAPSTHIVKQSHVRLSNIVTNSFPSQQQLSSEYPFRKALSLIPDQRKMRESEYLVF